MRSHRYDALAQIVIGEILGRFGESMMVALARRVDRIEIQVRERFPGAVHIDLEPHVRDVP